jgi:hypothetical protein
MTTTHTARIGSRQYELETEPTSDTVQVWLEGSWVGSADWNGTSCYCFRGRARRLAKGIARALSTADFRGPLARTLAA